MKRGVLLFRYCENSFYHYIVYRLNDYINSHYPILFDIFRKLKNLSTLLLLPLILYRNRFNAPIQIITLVSILSPVLLLPL